MRALLLIAVVAAGCGRPHAMPDGWRGAAIGSVYETKTVTRMQKPFEHTTESITRQTLLGRTDSDATLRLEITEAAATTTQNVTVALRAPAMPHDGTVTRSEETCTVPAGTFHCTRTFVELGDTSSMVTWTTPRVPVPLRTIVTNEAMTITTELTKLGG